MDISGDFWVVGAIVGGVVSGGMNLLGCYLSGQAVDWGQFAIDVAFGAMGGAISACTPSAITQIAGVACDIISNAATALHKVQTGEHSEFQWDTFIATTASSIAYSYVGDYISNSNSLVDSLESTSQAAAKNADIYRKNAVSSSATAKSTKYYNNMAKQAQRKSNTARAWWSGVKSSISSFISSLNIFG